MWSPEWLVMFDLILIGEENSRALLYLFILSYVRLPPLFKIAAFEFGGL